MNASTLAAVRDSAMTGPNHAVQFYESDDFLRDSVAGFIGNGLVHGEPVIVIATAQHRDAFAGALAARGLDVTEAEACGDLVMLDARETLATFMAGSMPDPQQFRNSVGGVIGRTARGRQQCRAYGEMVDLLWRDGNPDGAVRLEELWNDLAEYYTFNLLCAYPMGNFYSESHSEHFEHVCRTHSHVYPAESFSATGSDARALAREIAVLQQQARALASEIEHRKELENALRESLAGRRKVERDLKDFVDNATIGLHWVGPDGTILWANNAELELLDYSADEYIGHNITEFHASRATIDDILNRLSRNEVIHDYESALRAKDGSIRHVAISSNVLFEDGQFIHTRCFTRDVTDRKRLEAEARRASEDNEFLLHATTALNRSLDYDQRLRDVTELAVPRLAGWCAVDLAGEGNAAGKTLVCSGPRAETGHDFTLNLPLQIGDRPLGTMTLVRATPYEAADAALAAEFARRASEAIENARLYRLAQEANRIKDQFLATLSHELRTPLTAILGWSRMLTIGGLDVETMRTACGTIERAAKTQAALIDDLLDLSKVVTGKLSLRNEPVELTSVVESALETVRLAADTKGIRIDVAPMTDRAIVTGDPTRMQQIIWNLLSNAIKFSDAGGSVLVALETRTDVANIIIRDEGRGIAPVFLPHVFDPFRQADGAITREHGGLGLGLAIVKYLSELHGGSVTATSAGEGHGSTFIVTLPLAKQRMAKDEPAVAEEVTDISGIAVLVVDDDSDTRALVEAMLRRAGGTVVAAESVAHALSALGVITPDVIVSDLTSDDGAQLLRSLAADQRRRTIPVIALTEESEPEEVGFSASVRKPIDPLLFVRAVSEVTLRA
jgi:PAS domain S-box-containing protein